MTISMIIKKETKGTVVYEATDENAGIRSVYIQKSSLNKPYPQKITISIKDEYNVDPTDH